MTNADQPAQTTPPAVQPDVFPNHTPYTGTLPISVAEWLREHPGRRVEIRPIRNPAEGGSLVASMLYSEHGWPLATHRLGGKTKGEVERKLREHPIQYVQPRVSDDRTRWC